VVALWVALFSVPDLDSGQALPVKAETVPVYQPKYFPFEGGEKAVYRASWNGLFSVATAEIFTTPAMVDGRRVYNVRVEAKTSKALDLIWKMRDTVLSTFDAKALLPSRFSFHQKENSRVINTVARYNESTRRWAVHRQQVGKRAKVYEFDSQNTFDPLTAVYLARSLDFKTGDRLYFKVFGGRYRYLMELHVERKEPVTLESGETVQAFRIVPRLQNITKGGYAERMNEAVVWISADERRMPVKLSSKITFGSVHLDLVEDKHAIHSKAQQGRQPAS
jgi:SHS2 domain-containing protein